MINFEKSKTEIEFRKDEYVSDVEMKELKPLYPSLREGLKDAKEGRYRTVGKIEKRKDAYKYFK